jgi:hypothetical protein
MIEYRVIDLTTGSIDPHEKIMQAKSPENAAEIVLALPLVRSGLNNQLRVHVFSTPGSTPINGQALFGG